MVGLVLEGGGAKGAYHIGVWKALRELSIEVGAVTGTSVGALNGAFIVQDLFERAYDLWYNMDSGLVIKDNPELYNELITKKLQFKNIGSYLDYINKIVTQKGFDINPLIRLIHSEVDEDRIRHSNIEFGLVTVNLSELRPIEIFVENIENGKLADYLLASAFLPVFKPQIIDGKRFIDGAFYDNLPINLITKKNVTEVIAVQLDAIGRVKSVNDKHLNIRRIIPSGDTGSMLEFSRERSRDNLKMGYLDTLKSFGIYEGFIYYLSEVPSETYFYEYLLSFTENEICQMAELIGYNEGIPFRVLTERIVPEICDMLGFDINMSYKDIFVGIMEFLAEVFQIDRLAVYSYRELLEKVGHKCIEINDENSNKLLDLSKMPGIIKRQSIIQRTFRTKLLTHWFEFIYHHGKQKE